MAHLSKTGFGFGSEDRQMLWGKKSKAWSGRFTMVLYYVMGASSYATCQLRFSVFIPESIAKLSM